MRVCWRWYDIASPSFFAVVPIRYFHRQPLVKHFRAHPELAAYVQELHFFDMSYGDWGHGPLWGINPRPFDVQLLASTLPLFTNLTRLSITGCDNKTDLPQLLRRMTRRPHTPVPLQRLTLMSCGSDALMLHGLFSLFSVDTLVMAAGLLHTPHEKSAMRIEALFSPPAPVTIQNLVIRKVSRDLYEFLEGVLAPGGLQGLAISPTWQDDISHLHQFLRSPAAQNLVSINISPRKEFLYDAPPDVLGAPLVHKTFGAVM
ncbi:hypothetical protein GSI_11470 [Ganoderma sinense ZZ0214-1]|uniref:F-box domain-containing protein n=1 Tax=Ganoderma sinense ZZ0214-1 TaxID=1077348 RepID=A0A2G8RW31_9APHY|nr:hypothetical protein GSI_11470 [Ganoderma sinense ZZ0214-1]